jgi:uncharacterized protein (TIGR03067 family)
MKAEVAVLLAACLVAVDRFQDLMDTVNRQQLQGTWKVVSWEEDGRPVRPEAITGARLYFEEDSYTFFGGPQTYGGRFRLHSFAKPSAIDATLLGPDSKEEVTVQGVYRLEGKRLLLCWERGGGERPHEFTTAPGSRRLLIVAERR